MKSSLYLLVALVLSGTIARAQTGPAHTVQAPTGEFSEADQKELAQALSLARSANLWSQSLDWEETGSTTKEVAAHLRTMLGDSAPAIDVRSQDETRSTFVLPKATLGPVLCSLAELSNCRVWAFPDRLVIASEADLTDDERAAVKSDRGIRWTPDTRGNPTRYLKQVAVPLIGADLKRRLAAKGQTAPLAPPPNFDEDALYFASYELPYGELSTTGQKTLQDLVAATAYPNTPPPLTAGVVVCLDARSQGSESLFFKEPGVEKPLFQRFGWFVVKPRASDAPR